MLFELLKSFLIIFVFAIIISSVFIRFKISPVIGFLLTGIIVGPSALGLIQDHHLIETFAEFGVIFLMFIIGVEFSIKKLIAYRKEILVVGLIQVVLTILTVTLITLFFLKKSLSTGIFFGSLVAMSSTALVLKILMDRGELTTSYGRVCFGILIFQDLCVILIMLLIPILGGKKGSIIDIFFILGKSLAILSCAFIAGLYIFPLIFHQIVKTRSRELFLMTILVLSLGTAFFSYKLGLSLALGAFLAGIVISESEYALQTIAEIKPIKDLLMAIFFISVGLLLKPYFIFSNLKLTVLTILLILLIKISTAFLSALIVSKNLRISLLTGLILAQTGEFSLVLALEGKNFGLIEEKWYQIFIGSSIVTLFLTPFLIEWSHKLTDLFLEKISHKSYLSFEKRHFSEDILHQIGECLDREISVYLFGGGAMVIKGYKTSTKDIDICVINPEDIDVLAKVFSTMGYKVKSSNEIIVYDHKEKSRIDLYKTKAGKLLLSNTMLGRAEIKNYGHLKVYIASDTDLLLLKIIADRPRDFDDAKKIIRKGKIRWKELIDELLWQEEKTKHHYCLVVLITLEELEKQLKVHIPYMRKLLSITTRHMVAYAYREMGLKSPKDIKRLINVSEETIRRILREIRKQENNK